MSPSILRSSVLVSLAACLSIFSCDNDNPGPTKPIDETPVSTNWVPGIVHEGTDPDISIVYWNESRSEFESSGISNGMVSNDGRDWKMGEIWDAIGIAALGAAVVDVTGDRQMRCDDCVGGRFGVYDWEFSAIASNESIAVGVGESGHVAIHDGNSQQEHQTNVDVDFTDIVWDRGRFVTTAADGIVRRSTDGIAWSEMGNPHAGGPRAIAVDGLWIVVLGGDGQIVQSLDDGVTWATVPGYSGLHDVAMSGDGFVAVGDQGRIVIRKDLHGWTPVSTGVQQTLRSVIRGPELVAVGDDGVILVSRNGQSWEQRQPARWITFTDVVWTGETFVAAANTNTLTTVPVFLSSDGIDWRPAASVEKKEEVWDIFDIAWSGELAIGSATAYGTFSSEGNLPQHAKVYSSHDLEHWHIVHVTLNSAYGAQAFYYKGQFVVQCQNEVLFSSSGTFWTSRPIENYPFLQESHAITVRDDVVYGMRWNGSLMTSTDLITATEAGGVNLPGVKTDISWIGDGFLACGYNTPNHVWFSSDGTAWQAMNPGTQLELWAAAASDKRWVVVGEHGTIRTRGR